jgi:UDP-3-O-[3-hydroxymyristoyl] glucosamine N-acyltransferase
MSLNKVSPLARPARPEPVCLRLSEIAEMVGGTLTNGADPLITGVAGIREAGQGDLTFLSSKRYRKDLESCQAAAVLVDETQETSIPGVRTRNPALAFMLVLRRFSEAQQRQHEIGIHPTAVVDTEAHLGDNVSIGAHVVIEAGVEVGDGSVILPGTVILQDCRIGQDCMLHANVTLYENTEVGDRVILHSGVVLGSDGFGFVKEGQMIHKVPHIGRVVVEDDVEIGANSCIDRATTGTTRIRRHTKIDNLVQVGHNVTVGESSMLCAQVGVSGSSEVGDRVTLAGQVGVVGHVRIGDDSIVGAQGGVSKSVPDGEVWSDSPALPHKEALRKQAASVRLPEVIEELRQLRRRLARLEEEMGKPD